MGKGAGRERMIADMVIGGFPPILVKDWERCMIVREHFLQPVFLDSTAPDFRPDFRIDLLSVNHAGGWLDG